MAGLRVLLLLPRTHARSYACIRAAGSVTQTADGATAGPVSPPERVYDLAHRRLTESPRLKEKGDIMTRFFGLALARISHHVASERA